MLKKLTPLRSFLPGALVFALLLLPPAAALAGRCPEWLGSSGVSITLEGERFPPGAGIPFTVTGIKPEHVKVPSFNGIYVSFTKANQPGYVEYANVQKLLKAGGHSGRIIGPGREGLYDMKVFINAGAGRDLAILAQAPFEISKDAAPAPAKAEPSLAGQVVPAAKTAPEADKTLVPPGNIPSGKSALELSPVQSAVPAPEDSLLGTWRHTRYSSSDPKKPLHMEDYTFRPDGSFEIVNTELPNLPGTTKKVVKQEGVRYKIRKTGDNGQQLWFYAPAVMSCEFRRPFQFSGEKIVIYNEEFEKIAEWKGPGKTALNPAGPVGAWERYTSVNQLPNTIQLMQELTFTADGKFTSLRVINAPGRASLRAQRGFYRVSAGQLECFGVEEAGLEACGDYGPACDFGKVRQELEAMEKEYKPYNDYAWTWEPNVDGSLLLNGGDNKAQDEIFKPFDIQARAPIPSRAEPAPDAVKAAPEDKLLGVWRFVDYHSGSSTPAYIKEYTFRPDGSFEINDTYIPLGSEPIVDKITGSRFTVQETGDGGQQIWFYGTQSQSWRAFKFAGSKLVIFGEEYEKIAEDKGAGKPAPDPGKLVGSWENRRSAGSIPHMLRMRQDLTFSNDGKFTLERVICSSSHASLHAQRGSYRVAGDRVECFDVEEAKVKPPAGFSPASGIDEAREALRAEKREYQPGHSYTWIWDTNVDGSLLMNGGDNNDEDLIFNKNK